MSRHGLPVGAILMAAGITACGPADGPDAALPFAGSCGAPELVTAIGGVEPPAHTFGEVPDVARLSDGRVAALDRQAAELQIFDTDGHLVAIHGGSGEGPGELLDPIALDVDGDDAFVWDWRQARMTRFDLSTGDFETFPIRGQANPTHHFGLLAEGRFFLGTSVVESLPENENATWTTDLRLVVVERTSEAVDTVARVPDRITHWVDRSIRRVGSPHFSPRASAAASGGALYWSRGDEPLIVRRMGDRQDTVRWEWPIQSVEASDVEAYRRVWLASVPDEMHAGINRTVDAMPAAETFPVVRYLIRDHDGGIWAQIYNPPRDSTRTWLRLEDGQVDCRVALPVGFIASEGGRGWLLGVASGELAVESIERWELR